MKQDWALAGIGLFFVLAGLLLLPTQGAKALVPVSFFGVCGAVGVYNIARKRRSARLVHARVQAADGVTLRPSRLRVAGMAAILLLVALPILLFGRDFGIVMQAIGAFIALVAFVLLAGLALGRLPAGHLGFRSGGLEIGYRGFSALLPWDAIACVEVREFSNNPFVAICLRDWQQAVVSPPAAALRYARAVGTCRGTFQADVAIMPLHYGVDAQVLAASIRDRLPRQLPKKQ